MTALQIMAGRPAPLGSHWDGAGVNFAVFSAHAERIELNVFDGDACIRLELPGHTNDVWHGYVPGLRPGCRYGYRAYGPYNAARGLRFNPNKLLLDPYARWLDGDFVWDPALRAPGDEDDGAGFSTSDSAPFVPKSVVIDERSLRRPIVRPAVPWRDTVIYEAHVKGLTALCAELPETARGTFAGLAAPATIAHLRELGVTTVELLPIHAFASESFLLHRNLSNYWGYNSIAFFAPHARYLGTGSLSELTAAVDGLHAAGLEIILDVVFNHTAEGDALGPTYSFRGLDNTTYYRLEAGSARHYINDAGCGNSLAAYRPAVSQLIIDSLVYWYDVIGVDGFRFDLAVSLGRDGSGFDPHAQLFADINLHPRLAGAKLIAEPWDVGPDGYHLGGFPAPWSEWNDRYRDCVRRFWRGDAGTLPELATRMHGSSDLFGAPQRGPVASINFVTSHDGFTLADVATYSTRYNLINGEGNRDGHGENFSDNCGIEGPSDDPVIVARRAQRQRNLLATLLMSHGTPMLLAGDEVGHTQDGNNNAYCQDNTITWINWRDDELEYDLREFVARLLTIRREHPVLRRAHHVHGSAVAPAQDLADLTWLTPAGEVMEEHHWHDPARRTLAMVLVPTAAEREQGECRAAVIAINGGAAPATFKVARFATGYVFSGLLNTAGEPLQPHRGGVTLAPESLCVFTGVRQA